MVDRLIDLVIGIGKDVLPFSIVNQWEKGVHLRKGKFRRIADPGLRWKVPFFDKIWTTEVITQTVNLPAQTLTTDDDKDIVLKAIIRYRVSDVKKFLLSVMHASDVLVDTTQGIIRDIVERTEWYNLVDVNEAITAEVSKEVSKWGIEIEKVTLTDLGLTRTFRILSDAGDRHPSSSLGIDGL